MNKGFHIAAAVITGGSCVAVSALLAWLNMTGRTHHSPLVIVLPVVIGLVIGAVAEFVREMSCHSRLLG